MTVLTVPPLFDHQREAIGFILSRGGSGALFHEMGLGKTRTAIEVYGQLRAMRPGVLRMLVVAPLSLLEAAWHEDVRRFSNFTFRNLHNDPLDHRRPDEWEDIMVVNYEALLRNQKELAVMIATGRWMCVLDESSKIKNHQAQVTKILLKAAPKFENRIVMSGTPAPNTELEYWPQLQFVQPGCLGTSMTVFRSHFFQLVNRYTGATMTVGRFASRSAASETFRKCDYRITPARREELMEMIRPLAHMAKKRDCLDLPEQTDELRQLDMADDQKSAYRQMERTLILEIKGQEIAAPVALTKLMKLRQITSGFVYNAFGEALEVDPMHGSTLTGDPCTAQSFVNPKIKELLDVVDQAGSQPVIIWINFHWEQIKVCHELAARYGAEQVVTISSMTKDRDASIEAFKNGRARFLVAHPASAAHGLTFVNCSLQVFFSLDYSLERYEQARARTHRAGQKNPCTYVHLVCRGTIDEAVLEVLKKKGDAQEIVYRILNQGGKK